MTDACHVSVETENLCKPTVNLDVNCNFWWFWCVSVGSSITTNVTLVRGADNETVLLLGLWVYEKSLNIPFNFVLNLKGYKTVNLKKSQTKLLLSTYCVFFVVALKTVLQHLLTWCVCHILMKYFKVFTSVFVMLICHQWPLLLLQKDLDLLKVHMMVSTS